MSALPILLVPFYVLIIVQGLTYFELTGFCFAYPGFVTSCCRLENRHLAILKISLKGSHSQRVSSNEPKQQSGLSGYLLSLLTAFESPYLPFRMSSRFLAALYKSHSHF